MFDRGASLTRLARFVCKHLLNEQAREQLVSDVEGSAITGWKAELLGEPGYCVCLELGGCDADVATHILIYRPMHPFDLRRRLGWRERAPLQNVPAREGQTNRYIIPDTLPGGLHHCLRGFRECQRWRLRFVIALYTPQQHVNPLPPAQLRRIQDMPYRHDIVDAG